MGNCCRSVPDEPDRTYYEPPQAELPVATGSVGEVVDNLCEPILACSEEGEGDQPQLEGSPVAEDSYVLGRIDELTGQLPSLTLEGSDAKQDSLPPTTESSESDSCGFPPMTWGLAQDIETFSALLHRDNMGNCCRSVPDEPDRTYYEPPQAELPVATGPVGEVVDNLCEPILARSEEGEGDQPQLEGSPVADDSYVLGRRDQLSVQLPTLTLEGGDAKQDRPPPTTKRSESDSCGNLGMTWGLAEDIQTFKEYGEISYQHKKSLQPLYKTDNCLSLQTQLDDESRSQIIKWLIDSHSKYHLSFQTLCLAVNIMDRILLQADMAEDDLPLTAIACLMMASKNSETYSKKLMEFYAACKVLYPKKQLQDMEIRILNKINFRLSAPTISDFVEHYILQRMCDREPTDEELLRLSLIQQVAHTFGKLCLTDYTCCNCPPSLLGLCCLGVSETQLFPEHPVVPEDDDYPDAVIQLWTTHINCLVSDNHDYMSSLLPSESMLEGANDFNFFS